MSSTRECLILIGIAVVGCGDNLHPSVPDAPSPHDPTDAALDAPGPGIDRLFGGAQDDELIDVAVIDDEVIVAGYRDGLLGVENIEPVGPAAGVIEAFSLDGAPRWQRTLDTPGADTVERLLVEGASIAFVGRTTGAFPGFTNAGQQDVFVGTTPRTAGGAAPVFQLGTERPQHPRAITRDTTGAFLLAGFDDTYVTGTAVQDFENAWTARITVAPAYAVDWQRRSTTSTADRWWDGVAAGPAGELIVGGEITSGTNRGPVVSRLDANGSVMWNRRIEMIGLDTVTAIERGPDGLIYVAGATFEQLGPRTWGQQDIFVLALDPATGATMRAMQAGSTSSDYPRDLAIAADGTVYVVGETEGELPGMVASGSYDPVIVRFGPDDRWTGAWQRGTPDDDSGAAIALAPGGVVIVGFTAGAIVPGQKPGGRRDGFVLRVSDADFAVNL